MPDAPAPVDAVSLVVLTYNRCEQLCATLERLQALAPSVPLIVVDNASTDNTAARIRMQFPSVRLIRAAANLGAAGRNLGVQAASTPYVAFCDDDVYWLPDSLAKAQDTLNRYPDVAVLSARVLVGPAATTDETCVRMAASPLEGEPEIGPALVGFMAGACVFRVSAFLQAGGYWSGLFLGGEEHLLALDMLQQGWRILYAPQLQAWHFPSALRDASTRATLLPRNALIVAWMRLPWPDAWGHAKDVLSTLPGGVRRHQALLDAYRHYRRSGARRRPVAARVARMVRQVRRAEQMHGAADKS